MSRSGNNDLPTRSRPVDAAAGAARVRGSEKSKPASSDALAHELANLLDGSLRHLGLAISKLREPPAPAEAGDDLLPRLEAASTAMQHMATLIHRWMRADQTPGKLFDQMHTIGEAIEHTVKLMTPAAATRGIDVRITLQREAAQLPAGPIYPVIANALRNSIEAFDRATARRLADRAIDIAVRREADQLLLTVRDTGPGIDKAIADDRGRFLFGRTTKTDGHGVGLQLSREIAQSLGGELSLANHEAGGAVLTMRWPAPVPYDTDQP